MSAFPYDINHLLGGAVRVLYTPIATAIPVKPKDVFDQVSPYAADADFKDFGATKDAFEYQRNLTVQGFAIQQETGDVLEEVTNVVRSVKVSVAEITPETLQIIENAPSIGDIAAVAGSSEYKKVAYGGITDLDLYRVAFVSRRSKASGVVIEPTSLLKRGRFFAGVAYRCSIAAENVQLQQAKGALSAASITFTMFPEPGQAEGQEFGIWFDEVAGTIT